MLWWPLSGVGVLTTRAEGVGGGLTGGISIFFLLCQVLYALGPGTAIPNTVSSPFSAATTSMAPTVWCSCCNRNIAPKLERIHRKSLNSAPYPPTSPTYPSRQRRIFSRSSEADPDEFEGSTEAGPSNPHDAEFATSIARRKPLLPELSASRD